MPLSNSKVRSGFIIAFLLLLISYFLIFFIVRKVVDETSNVTHSYTVINKLEQLKAEVVDAETGLRGYLLTKDQRFLEPYRSGISLGMQTHKELVSLSDGSLTRLQHLDTLQYLINRRFSLMNRTITLFQQAGNNITDEMRQGREVNKSAMDSIRVYVELAKRDEQGVMLERKSKLARFFSGARIVSVASLITALITILYSLMIYYREKRDKDRSNARVKEAEGELAVNVDELKMANQELEELRSIEKFASTGRIARTIAHEVRNPLTNISLAAEQLRDLASGNEESGLLLDMITRNSNRINMLVADLLNATRFAQLDMRETNINQLVEETLEQAADRIELSHIRVEKHYDSNICPIRIDGEKMKVALLNIIVNAIEAMEPGKGLLEIFTRNQGNKCIVEIRDNGAGMDRETTSKLFEPYFTGKQKGHGLGLTNTQNIILNHKGTIQVNSKPGAGSTFTIFLNIAHDGE